MKLTSPIQLARKRGLSLTEVLVVIAIIAILAFVSTSAVSKFRAKAKSVQCMQNLREWSVVFARCAQDRNGRLPTPLNWAAISNQPYDASPNATNAGRAPFVDYWAEDLNQAFSIQLDKRSCPCLKEGETPNGHRAPTYMMNWRLSRAPAYLEMYESDLIRPSSKVLFIDGDLGCPLRISNKTEVTRWVEPAAKHHGGKVNAIFADLHVSPVDPKELAKKWNEMMLP